MNKKTTLFLVLTALFSALVFVVTFLLPVPIGVVGFVNFGDAIIFITSMVLGPLAGAVAGGVGSSLADLFLGYATYAPFTFVIKGAEGFVCGLLYKKLFNGKKSWICRLVSMTIAGAVATVGYFFADFILYGIYAALPNCAFMLLQVGVSMVIAFVALPRVPSLYDSVVIGNEKADETDCDESEIKEDTSEK